MNENPDPILVDLRVYHWSHSEQRYVPYNDPSIDAVTALAIIVVGILAVIFV